MYSLLFLLLWQDAIQVKGGEADLACSPEDAVHPAGETCRSVVEQPAYILWVRKPETRAEKGACL